MTTKREHEERARTYAALQSLGFTHNECESLRRISMTLRRWHELECGTDSGCVERGYRLARKNGAKRRLTAILARRNNTQNAIGATFQHPAGRLGAYIQTDPRGAALYILRPGDVPAGADAGAYYSRGICVY